ncbi:hypothetical protein [Methylovulum psychrotolerans]|nr:hypothetical protein [Methylovulum psychrotolerans]
MIVASVQGSAVGGGGQAKGGFILGGGQVLPSWLSIRLSMDG